MSYGSAIQSRLGFNFDLTKLSGAIDPNGDLSTKLSAQGNLITQNTATKYAALAAGNINTGNYYSNPVAGTCSLLYARITSIYNNVYNYSDQEESYPLRSLITPYSTLVTDLQRELQEDDNNGTTPKAYNTFISHTDRLSNVKTSNATNRPSFITASSNVTSIQALVYQLETTSTQTIGALAFGSFTSLFISTDLTNYYNTLNTALNSINSYIATNPVTPNQTIINLVSSAGTEMTNLYSLLVTRRTHDENFFVNATAINQDLNKITNNTLIASTSTDVTGYLIKNIVGTNTLKNLL